VPWDLVSKIADLGSLVSIALTWGVLVVVREIRRTILYKARGRELLGELVEHKSTLSTFLTNFAASTREFQRQLAPIEVALRSLETKVGWYFSTRTKDVRRVRKLVEARRNGDLDEATGEIIYRELAFLTDTLEQDWRDRQWLV
jgi:hypothetical protein